VSYPCRLPRGHRARPPGDPEPCFAEEVPSSAQEWHAWWSRQQSPPATHDCGGTLRLSEDGTQVICTGECGYSAKVVADEVHECLPAADPHPLAAEFTAAGASSRALMEQRQQPHSARRPAPSEARVTAEVTEEMLRRMRQVLERTRIPTYHDAVTALLRELAAVVLEQIELEERRPLP
jgi:hypothetical protein